MSRAFDLDLPYGQEREGSLLAILTNKDVKVEVKSDRRAPETGNIFVEYESRGKPSGIATTEADIWAYELGEGTDVWVIIPTDRLRSKWYEILEERGYVRGGDGYTSLGVLIPIRELIS